jgi:DNA-binding Lrp family transcriptional regulator
VDERDLELLATMGYVPWSPTASDPDRLRPKQLAQRLDVTPETVRQRTRAMEEAGVIRDWEAYPNPGHLDLRVGGWALTPDERDLPDEVLAELELVDGVLEVFTYRGPLLGVALAYADEAQRDRRLDLLSRRLADPHPVHVIDPPIPSVDRELDPLDWRIAHALRGDARRPLSEVADEVDRSYRTVKRRFDRMTQQGSLFLAPRVDLSHVEGVLAFTLAVSLEAEPETVRDPIAAALDDRVLHELVPPDPDADLLVVASWARTVHEMGRLEDAAAAVDGVRRAQALLSAGRRATDWLDERIRART